LELFVFLLVEDSGIVRVEVLGQCSRQLDSTVVENTMSCERLGQ